MTRPDLILVCDHAHAGLSAAVRSNWDHVGAGTYTRTLAESMQHALSARVDLVVLDPAHEGGAEELALIRSAPGLSSGTGILLVVDGTRPETGLEVLARQAFAHVDIVHRDARPAEFGARLQRLLGLVRLGREMDELRYRATHDERTGLLRPLAFQERIEQHVSAAERHRFDLAFVLIDLDRFGAINKRLDHTVGDRALTRVGEAIRAALRTEDVAGRLGGDEFGVCLPYTRCVDASRVVVRLLEEIRLATTTGTGLPVGEHITASIGFETFNGADLESLVELRMHAEIALRAAKRAGGDRGVYFRALAAGREPEPLS